MLFTSGQLSFNFKDDIYPNNETTLLFATQNDFEPQWRKVRFGLISKWADNTDITIYTYNIHFKTVMKKPSFHKS